MITIPIWLFACLVLPLVGALVLIAVAIVILGMYAAMN